MPNPPASNRPARAGVRPDIQGLRAVAVLGVVADHLLGAPAGGFLGVDVFFAISGFLITGLLLRELAARGRVSFGDFYARRARRILPAAVLVLAVTAVAAEVALPAARARSVLLDVLAAAAFGMNWREVAVGTDYFAAGGPASPLQHFWSLAVEEQFYLLWPCLLLAGTLLLRRRPARGAVVLMSLVTVASAVWALHESAADPTVAYFSTLSRGWELGLGGLGAVVAPRAGRTAPALRRAVAWVGCGAVVLALTGLQPGPVPMPGALAAVLGTTAVLVAGGGLPPRALLPLTSRLAGWIGNRSYSLYLWHLPVIVLLPMLLPVRGLAAASLAGALIALLAAASFALVEEPFRHRRAVPGRRGIRSPMVGAGGLGAIAVLAVLAAGLVPAPRSARAAAPAPVPTAVPTAAAARPSRPSSPAPQAALTAAIRAALAARTWPALTPSLDRLDASARVPEWSRDDCLVVTRSKLRRCTWGATGAARTVAVLGDSTATNWLPAVRRALEPRGYRVVALTMAQCPAGDVAVTDTAGSASFAPQCRDHLNWVVGELQRRHPSLVLATSATETIGRLVGGGGLETWRRGEERFLRRIRPLAGHVVVLDPAPLRVPLADCATRFSSPADCVGTVRHEDRTFDETTAQAAAAAGAAHVPTKPWFCLGLRCPAFAEGAPMYVDREHLTGAYAALLGPVLGAALRDAGVPG